MDKEELEKIIKDYIKNNLTINIETDYDRYITVNLLLNGEYISTYSDQVITDEYPFKY